MVNKKKKNTWNLKFFLAGGEGQREHQKIFAPSLKTFPRDT